MKPLPKSLHTVTVLVKVAELIYAQNDVHGLDKEGAVANALRILGYSVDNDPHGLAAAAIKQLSK